MRVKFTTFQKLFQVYQIIPRINDTSDSISSITLFSQIPIMISCRLCVPLKLEPLFRLYGKWIHNYIAICKTDKTSFEFNAIIVSIYKDVVVRIELHSEITTMGLGWNYLGYVLIFSKFKYLCCNWTPKKEFKLNWFVASQYLILTWFRWL